MFLIGLTGGIASGKSTVAERFVKHGAELIDETPREGLFGLQVAVVHPDSQVVAYHLLWRDDAHGAWIPFTVPTT